MPNYCYEILCQTVYFDCKNSNKNYKIGYNMKNDIANRLYLPLRIAITLKYEINSRQDRQDAQRDRRIGCDCSPQ